MGGDTTTLIAVNVCGFHVKEREGANAVAEAGEQLRWVVGKKEREVMQMLTAGPHRGGLAVLADTHLDEAELERVVAYLREVEGLGAYGTPGTYSSVSKSVMGGVLVIWDMETVEVDEISETGELGQEIMEGRVVRVEARMIRDQSTTAVYGVYMPVRWGRRTQVEPSWRALEEALEKEERGRVAVGGDLNAETPEWFATRRPGAASRLADRRLGRMLEEHNLRALARGATYRDGTQIDNWLVSEELDGHVGLAEVMPGVCGDDHQAVVVRCYCGSEEARDKVERPKGSPAAGLKTKEDVESYVAECQSKYVEAGGHLTRASEPARWDEELRVFQDAAAACARAVVAKPPAEDEGAPRHAARSDSRAKDKKELARWRVAKWRRHAQAVGWWRGGEGGRAARRGVWGVKELTEDAQFDQATTNRERRRRAVQVCEDHLRKAKGAFERQDGQAGDQVLAEMEEAVVGNVGLTMVKMFKILRKAISGGGAQSSRLAAMYRDDDPEQGTVHGPAVREEVERAGERINRRREIDTGALTDLLGWVRGYPSEGRSVDVAEGVCSWEACERSIAKFKPRKGLGADGFDGYLVRLMPEPMKRQYHRILQGIVRERQYPKEWNEWIAVLAMKPGEDSKKLGRRRDLWMQCHSCACVMRMLAKEFDRAAWESVGGSQAGFTPDRNAPEQTLVARLMAEQAASERTPLCRAYLDFGTFFQSVAYEVSAEVEKWSGVAPEVSEVVRHLREGLEASEGREELPPLTGRYETEFGLTGAVLMGRGLGQGDAAAACRSKLVLAVVSGVIEKMCRGRRLRATKRSVPTLLFADDAMLQSDDVQTLGRAVECAWMVAKVAGLDLQVKGKRKSAWSAVYWKDGKEVDVEGWEMRMPDGVTVIPQLVGAESYKYLGTEMPTGWSSGRAQDEARAKVVRACRQMIGLIGRAPLTTEAQIEKAIALGVGGIMSYYARSTVVTWSDCVTIEKARIAVLRARGFTAGVPRSVVYDARGAGLGHVHVYAYAAAALCDQVDRALCGHEGQPARLAVEDALASTCARLGCRGTHPLEWNPTHLEGELRDELMIEAYLKARMRLGLRGRLTRGGGKRAVYWFGEASHAVAAKATEEAGPKLWEPTEGGRWGTSGRRCTWSRHLAEHGIATWADVTRADTGALRTWAEMRRAFAITAQQGRACNDYKRMCEELERDEWRPQRGAWEREARERSELEEEAEDWARWRDGAWEVEELRAARRAPACYGGMEYLVKWEGEGWPDSWEPKAACATSGLAAERRRAETTRMVPTSFGEWLGWRASGGGVEAREARAVRDRMKDTEAMGDLRNAWRLFVIYSEDASRWDVNDNARDVPPAETGEEGWVRDEVQTFYRGSLEVEKGEDGKEHRRWVTSLEAHTAAERARAEECRVGVDEVSKREAADGRARAEAQERGESTYESPLPSTMPLERIERDAETGRVWRGRDDPGFELARDRAILADPVARLLLRSDSLEQGAEVEMRRGRCARFDRASSKVMRGRAAVAQSARVARVLLALHAAHHFTRAAATDGSKAGGRDEERGGERAGVSRTAYGIFEGASPYGKVVEGVADVQATPDEELAAFGEAMYGGRLPDSWQIADAEMWAIFRYLCRVRAEERSRCRREGVRGEDALRDAVKRQRVLIVSDCRPALLQVEAAWDSGRAEGLRRGDRAGLLEAICRVRAQLGLVVTVWVPAHKGVSPNEMADCAAKAYLGEEWVEDVTHQVADLVDARPYLNERRVGEKWDLADRRPFAEHRRRACESARREVGRDVPPGRAMAGRVATWADVARRSFERKPPEGSDGTPQVETWEDLQEHNACVGVMLQLRVGEVLELRHERMWQREVNAEGAAGGAATRSGAWGCWACRLEEIRRAKAGGRAVAARGEVCDAKHAVTGRCAAALQAERGAMDAGVETLQRMVTRERRHKGRQQRTEQQLAGEAEWQRVITGARRATQRSCSGFGNTISAADWTCLQQLLASATPEWAPSGAKDSSMTASRVDDVLRGMRRSASTQLAEVGDMERPGVRWMEEREGRREWLRTVLRAWREAHVHADAVLTAAVDAAERAAEETAAAARGGCDRGLRSASAKQPAIGRRLITASIPDIPRLVMPKLTDAAQDSTTGAPYESLICMARQLVTWRRVMRVDAARRAGARWRAAITKVCRARRARARLREWIAKVLDSMRAEKAAAHERSRASGVAHRGRESRPKRMLSGEYNEKRRYEKRSAAAAGTVTRRATWRRAGGATVGQAMLRRIEGSMPMTRRARTTTRQRSGEDADGGADREQYHAGHCEGIT